MRVLDKISMLKLESDSAFEQTIQLQFSFSIYKIDLGLLTHKDKNLMWGFNILIWGNSMLLASYVGESLYSLLYQYLNIVT